MDDDMVKRFDLCDAYDGAFMDESSDGGYVDYSDHLAAIERLSAEKESAEQHAAKLKHKLKMAFSEDDKLIVMKEMQAEINTLRARIAQLESAGAIIPTEVYIALLQWNGVTGVRLRQALNDHMAEEVAAARECTDESGFLDIRKLAAMLTASAQEAAMQALATQAQELNMGYGAQENSHEG